MMPDELFFCDDSNRVASLPPSEVLKTLYEKDAKDLGRSSETSSSTHK